MAIILPNEKLVLNAYAVLVGETPGNAALEEHLAYIAANGTEAYTAVLNSIFADQSNATLATTMLANLGLSSIFTQAEAEAFLAGNAANRVGAMINLSNALYNYSGTDTAIVAAHDAYVNAITGSYNYSIDPDHVAGADLSGDIISGGQTFALTSGTDILSGTSGNDNFVGDDGTFTSFDSIDGGAGTDSLTVTEIGGGVTTTTKVVLNIETATLRSDVGAVTADTTNWTGLTALNVTNAGDTVDVTAADTTAVSISNVDGGSIFVDGGMGVTISDVTGNNNVVITTAASTTVSLTDVDAWAVSITDNSTDANVLTTVVLDGAVDNQNDLVVVTGDAVTNLSFAHDASGVYLDNTNSTGFTLNISLDDNAGTIVTDANGFAEAVAVTLVSESELTLNAAGATEITVAGEGVLSLAEGGFSDLDSVETITVTGAAGLTVDLSNFAALTTLDAGDTTGNITVTDADATVAALAITTGSGDDSVTTTGALDADAVITLGAGDDTYSFDAAAVDGAAVDGGDGTDTLAVADGSLLTDAYANFEVLEVGGGTSTYNMDTLAGVEAVTLTDVMQTGNIVIDNAAAGTTLDFVSNDGAYFDVSDDNGGNDFAFDYQLASDTAHDSLDITLTVNDGNDDGNPDGYVWIAGTLTAANIETVNLVSQVGTLDVDDAGTAGIDESTVATEYTNYIDDLQIVDATTLNITASAAIDFTDVGSITATALQTLNISGAGDVTIGAIVTDDLVKVDAHTATGAIDIDVSAANQSVEFLGGAGDDTYVATVSGDTINAGAGADDITLDVGYVAIDTLVIEAGDSVLNADVDGNDVITNFGTANGAGALDVIDLGTFGFTGTASSALANKGALAGSVVDGTVLEQADFFSSGGFDRGVAIGTNGGDTYVFIDANKDGNFTAADDVMLQLVGVTDVTLANFGF